MVEVWISIGNDRNDLVRFRGKVMVWVKIRTLVRLGKHCNMGSNAFYAKVVGVLLSWL